MPLAKTYLKNGSKCKVTFKIPKDQAGTAEQAALVGDFNGWDGEAAPMKKLKNGCFSLTLNLPVGTNYQFRYLLDGNSWINDAEADEQVHCAYAGCENSVLRL